MPALRITYCERPAFIRCQPSFWSSTRRTTSTRIVSSVCRKWWISFDRNCHTNWLHRYEMTMLISSWVAGPTIVSGHWSWNLERSQDCGIWSPPSISDSVLLLGESFKFDVVSVKMPDLSRFQIRSIEQPADGADTRTIQNPSQFGHRAHFQWRRQTCGGQRINGRYSHVDAEQCHRDKSIFGASAIVIARTAGGNLPGRMESTTKTIVCHFGDRKYGNAWWSSRCIAENRLGIGFQCGTCAICLHLSGLCWGRQSKGRVSGNDRYPLLSGQTKWLHKCLGQGWRRYALAIGHHLASRYLARQIRMGQWRIIAHKTSRQWNSRIQFQCHQTEIGWFDSTFVTHYRGAELWSGG